MKIGIMQPYFLPYIGYFQLINISEKFVVLDNVQYIRRGWINRNKYLLNNKDRYFTIPITKIPQHQNIVKVKISKEYDRKKILKQFYHAYKKAPHFDKIYPLLDRIILYSDQNLFRYVLHSISEICEYLDIKTKFYLSSNIRIDHNLRSEKKIIALCKFFKSNLYINSSGGEKIYKKDDFKKFYINIKFLNSSEFRYKQFNNNYFIPNLSIVDVLMFNSKKTIKEKINNNFILK